jgi:hypothetical protein
MPSDTTRTVYSIAALVALAILAAGSIDSSSNSSSSSSSGGSSSSSTREPPTNSGGSSIPRNRERVSNSGWDGSVYQVKRYLKNNLKDPDSYQSIEWGPVSKKDGGYMVRHKYRAKNSFGGYDVQDQIFMLDSEGNVTETIP